MNREILFKAKRRDNGEWVEGYLISDEKEPDKMYIGYLLGVENGTVHDIDVAEVDPDTICQYTGMNDALENKIYENDIVKCGDYIGSVKYEKGCFLIKWSNAEYLRKDLDYWVNDINIRIVGNTFDAPKPLRKESDSVIYHDFMKKGTM